MGQAPKLQFACTNSLPWYLPIPTLQETRAWKTGGRSNSHQLIMNSVYPLECYFDLVFPHIIVFSLRFFYFSMGVQLLDPMHASCTISPTPNPCALSTIGAYFPLIHSIQSTENTWFKGRANKHITMDIFSTKYCFCY